MKTIEVKFNIEYPDNVNEHELQEFLEFELGVRGGISLNNPLSETDIMSMGINQIGTY